MDTLVAHTITIIDELVCEPVRQLEIIGITIRKNNECIIDYLDNNGDIVTGKSNIHELLKRLGLKWICVTDDLKNTVWSCGDV